MSKNTSPQARPARSWREKRRESAASAVDKRGRLKKPAPPDRSTNQARLREFLPLSLITNVIIVSLLVAVALAALLLTNSSFVGLPAAIAQLWLAANGAPVASNSAELGFVPLLPAIGVVAFVAWRVYSVVKDKVSLADLVILVACVLGVPLLLTLTAIAMLADAATVLPVALPTVAVALGRVLLLHAVAMVIGMGGRLWRALERRYAPDSGLFGALRLALRFWGYLLAAALLMLIVLLGFHHGTAADLYRQLSGPGSVVGLSLLSILYVPNLVIGLAFVLLGGEFALAEGSLSLFGSYLVPLPPLPILAAVPGSVWPYAWLFLLVPLVSATYAMMKPIRCADRPFRDVVLAGAWSLVIALLLLAFCVGKVGGYGVIGPVWWLALLTAPLWLWGPGIVIAGVGWILDSRRGSEEDLDPVPGAEPLLDDVQSHTDEPAAEGESEAEGLSEEGPAEEPADSAVSEQGNAVPLKATEEQAADESEVDEESEEGDARAEN